MISGVTNTSEFSNYKIQDLTIKKNNVYIPESFFTDNDIVFFLNHEEFIKTYPNYYKLELEKKEVFFLETKSFLIEEKNKLIKSYKKIKYLDLLINKIAIDKRDTENHTITYEIIQKKKLSIKNFLDFDSIKNIDNKILSLMKISYSKFNTKSELDKEIRITFLKKAIEDTFSEDEITFVDVINKFERLIQQYEIIVRAYIEELNTEKIKYDYEKRIQEINEKLSSMVGDIHTKQIILPIAFVIGVAQIKSDTSFFIAIMILLGLTLFTSLLTMYSGTQKKLIHTIEKNVEYWESFYENNLNSLYINDISSRINNIKDIIKKVKNNMFWTIFFSWSLIVLFMVYIVFKY